MTLTIFLYLSKIILYVADTAVLITSKLGNYLRINRSVQTVFIEREKESKDRIFTNMFSL